MHSEPIAFKPIEQVSPAVWYKPASFEFARQVSQIPLSDSELLLTSSCLPIAIDCISGHPRVVAIIDQRFLRSPAIGANGQWRKAYLPISLRCLPFRLTGIDDSVVETAINLPHGDDPGQPLFAEEGKLASSVAAIVALLRRLEEGKVLLQHAASQLLIAGVLTPLHLGPNGVTGRSFTVSREQFSALSSQRTALLAKENFLAIDLAAACIFSQRHLATLVSVKTPSVQAVNDSAPTSQAIDDLINPLRLNAQVDDQSLFSYEQYCNTIRAS